MFEAQNKIRTIIYSIFAVIIGFVLIRVLLKLVGVNPNNEFADFWYTFSDVFVEPWAIIYPNIISGKMIIEIYSIIAILFYIIISVVLSKSASSPFEDTRKQAIVEIVDSMFKVVEFLLITRFIFKLTAASTSAAFVRLIYDLSWIVYEPFATLMPAINFEGARFEISTLIALIIIIVLDLVTEQLLFSILDAIFPMKKKPIQPVQTVQQPPQQIIHHYPQNVPASPLPVAQTTQPQNININLPPQPGQTTYVDRRQVNVQPKPAATIQRKSQKKGFLQWPKKRSSRQGGPANS